MAVNTFPASAGYSAPDWTLISTATPTSGGVVTFSSIPSYRYLRVVFYITAASGPLTAYLRLNGATANYDWSAIGQDAGTNVIASAVANTARISFPYNGPASSILAGDIIINDTNKAYPKSLDVQSWVGRNTTVHGTWRDTATVTSLSLHPSITLTSGNVIYLYGSN
jgi:hypothetical protein